MSKVERRNKIDRRVGLADNREVKVEKRKTLRRKEDKENKMMYYIVLGVAMGVLFAIGVYSVIKY